MQNYFNFDLLNVNVRDRYACLILLIQLWGTKIDVLFLSSLILRKVDSLQKCRIACVKKLFVRILIFLVFSKSSIQYLWEGEISICKVLVLIKVVPAKSDYFLHQKFELHR